VHTVRALCHYLIDGSPEALSKQEMTIMTHAFTRGGALTAA